MTQKLNNDIAEKVMGWKKTRSGTNYWHLRADDEYESIVASRVGKSGPWLLHDGVGGGTSFTPSKFAEHCKMVKEHLLEVGIAFEIQAYPGKDKPYWVSNPNIIVGGPHGLAKTEEEAVCLFSLACHQAGLLKKVKT